MIEWLISMVKNMWPRVRGAFTRIVRQIRAAPHLSSNRKLRYETATRLFPFADGRDQGGWVFHSERWIRVVHRWEHRRALQERRCLSVVDNPESPARSVAVARDGTIEADVSADSIDKWVYLYLRPEENIWRNFSWKFNVRRDTDFRELQFGFRYQDFYNRYRVRHEDDFVYIDKVINGRFDNALASCPLQMSLGRDYAFEIRATDAYLTLAVNDVVCLEAYDHDNSFPQGSIAVILWENDGKTPIRVCIKDHLVAELIGQPQH